MRVQLHAYATFTRLENKVWVEILAKSVGNEWILYLLNIKLKSGSMFYLTIFYPKSPNQSFSQEKHPSLKKRLNA